MAGTSTSMYKEIRPSGHYTSTSLNDDKEDCLSGGWLAFNSIPAWDLDRIQIWLSRGVKHTRQANVRREIVRNSQGTYFNNIHPLDFSLVKTAATAPLRGLFCQFLCAYK